MSRQAISKSEEMFDAARRLLPGGVNSPVRAFKAVGGTPRFIRSGRGARITDVDGNEYIDYVCSYGPLLFGHAPDFLLDAVAEALVDGTCYGAPTAREVELAELVAAFVPSIEMVRFVNSGSEATASAIRLARGFTGRPKILKCEGCYHGSVDSLLVTAGSGVATLGIPETPGIPATVAAETIAIPYNDFGALKGAFSEFGDQIAGFILEPIAANMGLIAPKEGYLELARTQTADHGAVLIFDEVISGFRVAPGGAQELYGVQPDLTCLGKILGGGIPVGAYGGRRDIMEKLAPLGPVYQAGTLSGNPVAMAAGIAMLKRIESDGPSLYEKLEDLGARFESGIRKSFESAGVPVSVHRIGSLLTPFFSGESIFDYETAKTCDKDAFRKFFHGCLELGVYLAPSQYECAFVSAAHTADDIDQTVRAMSDALRANQ